MKIFANSKPPQARLFVQCNSASVNADGWAHLAPYGDFQGVAWVCLPDGSKTSKPAIQRIDQATVKALVDNFKSPWAKLKRFFTGCWIFNGHPDITPDLHTDPNPKGMIADLQQRPDGLYGLPVFTEEGNALIAAGATYFSAAWNSDEAGTENGTTIYRPSKLISAGLTDNPNLPVHILNTKPPTPPTPPSTMDKTKLAAALLKNGVTIEPNASDMDFQTAILTLLDDESKETEIEGKAREAAEAKIGNQLAAAQAEAQTATAKATEAANLIKLETDKRTAAEALLANEKNERIQDALERAIETGRITAAEKADWKTRLVADFANSRSALMATAPKLNTTSKTAAMGGRNTFVNTGDKIAYGQTLVAEKMKAGLSYNQAFTEVEKERPELFAAPTPA